MATARTKKKGLELAGQVDPRGALDGAAFLAAAQPVLRVLDADLLARAKGSAAVGAALRARYEAEKAARRTADSFLEWQERFVGQVGAAWLLSCVFVRTLEDRGLASQMRIAGEGAADSQRLFFEMAPSLTERDYLLLVFRELSRFAAARDLFDSAHNPVWMLAPSAEAAKALLGLFRSPSVDAPAYRFGQADTRFLGDLYQDLDEGVRKRFALLQTPRFVESFILDRTLEPAITKFGLDETDVIDPTCGSGHFLLGAFDRLFEHRLRAEPGLGAREAARNALNAVYGSDINPYAVAIARFRLTLSFLEKAGYRRLAEAPRLPLHVVVADSLLHNPHVGQTSFGDLEGQSARAWHGEEYALENEEEARAVLHRRYAAVVGNPPYITVQDAVLRERYRESYPRSAAGKYSVAAPFTERFFQLARPEGRVGMITANSFMKREFGKKLIEQYLPTVNLEVVVNTAGAYIPGHGTPTVLLFGSSETKRGTDVLTVLASRGEPSTPEDPEQGLVWRSIADHWSDVGFENEYITVSRTPRGSLEAHPWSLGGGGATELKELLEERAEKRLGDVVDSIGFMAISGEDEAFAREPGAWERVRAEREWIRRFGIGEEIRDWTASSSLSVFFPYTADGLITPDRYPMIARALWPLRRTLLNRPDFGGKKYIDVGRTWYELHQVPIARLRNPLSIAFAFVATHNHFVLDRGGKVFNRSAPIIKLPETATEDDHYALLAYLNSSTACFWMKQVFMNKGATSDRGVLQADEDKFRYEFDGTKLRLLPLPATESLRPLIPYAKTLTDELATIARGYREALSNEKSAADLAARWREIDAENRRVRERAVALQEEIDWFVYALFHIEGASPYRPPFEARVVESGYPADERPFLSAQTPCPERRAAAVEHASLGMLETSEYKRRWYRAQGKFNSTAVDDDQLRLTVYWHHILDTAESVSRDSPDVLNASAIEEGCASVFAVTAQVAADLLPPGISAEAATRDALQRESVPYLAALRYTDAGLEKRAEWERTWELQPREDRGEKVGDIPVPPKYDQKDFRDASFFRLRGKLDVPKERFISYPGCESDEDHEPVYGWAGWDHEQRAKALATLYWKRKNDEGWSKERLTPLLAGLLELVFWLELWHSDKSDDYGGDSPANYYSGFLDTECQAWGLTRDDLRAWRPAKKGASKAGPSKAGPSKAGPTKAGAAKKAPAKARTPKGAKAAEESSAGSEE